MLITSQNKDEIVNFNNVISIQITDCDGDYVISAIALVGIEDFYRELGYYKTEERAQEVLQEIAKAKAFFEEIKVVDDTFLKRKLLGMRIYKDFDTYEMPKE